MTAPRGEVVGDMIATCPQCQQKVTKVWIGGMDGALCWKHCGAFFAPTSVETPPKKADRDKAVSDLVKSVRYLMPYLDWTLGPESPGHHPTMPSAVQDVKLALAEVYKT